MSNPRYLLGSVVPVTSDDRRRVLQLMARVGGVGRAIAVLGVGADTFEAARFEGRLAQTTLIRLRRALDREEAAWRERLS